ncbi:MAG TPA: NADH:flavin oxidoreductase [Ignavibacteria bacterium]|nr:NADH:flavin oxidoreductase [Ignavibacteria bacterium]
MKLFKLLTPYTFSRSGKISKNRIALAPLTNLQSNADGTLSDAEYRWLTRRAEEEFGIIFTCASHVSADGQGWAGEFGIFNDVHLPGLTKLSNGIHQYGSLAIVQIFHGGARSPEKVTGKQPWSASAHSVTGSDKTTEVREATEEDIEIVTEAFAAAAMRAHTAGFDGVEIHGAHGYLLHQFLSTFTNHRNDKWGGSFENRIRLLLTIFRKIKSAVPATFMVGVRLSPEDKPGFKGIDFDESLQLAEILAAEGADFIDVSAWDAFKKPEKYKDGEKTIIEYFREKLPADIPIMTAGKIWTREDAEKVIEMGADFIALGKSAIGIPDWPSKIQDEKYKIQLPPYSVKHLKEADLSDPFIEYMKRWPDFVEKD